MTTKSSISVKARSTVLRREKKDMTNLQNEELSLRNGSQNSRHSACPCLTIGRPKLTHLAQPFTPSNDTVTALPGNLSRYSRTARAMDASARDLFPFHSR